jgi:hypothetical protein
MKHFLTIFAVLISLMSFGQADIKFDIMDQIKMSMDEPYTKMVDFDKPDTCYIHVITNNEKAIEVLKNTYKLVRYESNSCGMYTFYFPKSSGARIITNLHGAKVDFKVHKVIHH